MDEGAQRRDGHGIVMLEHRMQTHDHNLLQGEDFMHRLDLWKRMGHAAGAQHLESQRDHDMAALRLQIQWRRRVQPFRNAPGRRLKG